MQRLGWMLCVALLVGGTASAQDKPPIVLGLHADMSSGSALAGEAIRRGVLLAIAEINAQGGLLGGRKLELVVRDHHGVPARPKVRDALEQLGPYKGLVRTYQPAFTPSRHEALEPSDYRLTTFTPEGVLVPSPP